MAHSFVHIELSAQDPAASSKFYSELCGWKIDVDPRFDYYQFSGDGGLAGAIVKTDGKTYKPGDIVPYIGTDDIDAMLKKVVALGGKVLQIKTEIPEVGWFAFFSDPAGNRMGLFAAQGPS